MSKPWYLQPVQYNDDRFESSSGPQSDSGTGDADEHDKSEIEELLQRPDRKSPSVVKDPHPIDYSKGPHDEEFGVDENEFDKPDDVPVDYGNGPHDEEFGDIDLSDDEEFQEHEG